MTRPANDKRNLIWKHTGFFGHARMMQKQLQGIVEAETTTDQTKRFAEEMLWTLVYLKLSLETRKDQLK